MYASRSPRFQAATCASSTVRMSATAPFVASAKRRSSVIGGSIKERRVILRVIPWRTGEGACPDTAPRDEPLGDASSGGQARAPVPHRNRRCSVSLLAIQRGDQQSRADCQHSHAGGDLAGIVAREVFRLAA